MINDILDELSCRALNSEISGKTTPGRRTSAVMQCPKPGTERTNWEFGSRHLPCGAPNVLTLSCKNRLPCLPREAARRLPRPTRSGRSELQPTGRGRAVRAARGGAPPGQRTGGFCQLVRVVRRRCCRRRRKYSCVRFLRG